MPLAYSENRQLRQLETLLIGAFDHFTKNRPYINRTLCGDNFVVL